MENNEIREIEEVTTEAYEPVENETVQDRGSNAGGAGLLLLGGALIGSLVTVGVRAVRKRLAKRKAIRMEKERRAIEANAESNTVTVVPEDNEE